MQARVWNNPYLIWNQELYSVERNRYLSAQDQFLIQVEQVFSIAGKHTNTVKLARINLELNKVQFQDVLRSLLYELEKTYNDLAAFEEKEKLYSTVLASYQKLILASEKELEVGAISVTEAVRIKSEFIAVKAQAVDNSNQKEIALSYLRTLLQYPSDTLVHVRQRMPIVEPRLQPDSLVSYALARRPDLRVGQLYQAFQEQNLRLQVSSAIPDIKIGYNAQDKAGNYVRNYSGINLEFPLPIFNRNQGNIQGAKAGIKQAHFQLEYMKGAVANQVMAAYNQYRRTSEGLTNYTEEYLNKIIQLNQNTNFYFQKRDISLLEFIDQQRIYITTFQQFIELRQRYLNTVNDLNFSIGSPVIEY